MCLRFASRNKMATRVGVSKPIAGSARGRRRVAAQQTNRGTLSVKELNEELERARQNEVSMRNKLRALESEVETLRLRLDGLRKAKNTTIVKREREPALAPLSPKLGQRGFPPLPRAVSQLGHASTDSASKLVSREREVVELEERVHELETRLTGKDEEWRATLAEREEALSAEWERRMKDLRVQLSKGSSGEDVASLHAEISKLISRNDELTAAVFSLQQSHQQLKVEKEEEEARCAALEEELREKEDHWRKTEQQLTAEIRRQWGERYHEWITKAEKKMDELRKVNEMLQMMLKSKVHNPD